jgi:hypothetical protein
MGPVVLAVDAEDGGAVDIAAADEATIRMISESEKLQEWDGGEPGVDVCCEEG